MNTTMRTRTYTAIVKEQQRIVRAVSGLSQKLRVLGKLSDFDGMAKKGRLFAKRQGITKRMVLKDD